MASFLQLQVQGETQFNAAPSTPTSALRRTDLDVAMAAPIVLAGVTRFTGGTATDLDNQTSAALVTNARYKFTEASTGDVRIVRLVLGSQATAAPDVVRTLNFDLVNSPTVFVLEPAAGDDPRLSSGTSSSSSSGNFLPTTTSVGDGASSSLEALPTAEIATPAFRNLYNVSSDDLENWLLVASTAATSAGVQRPEDFNAATNAKVWFRK